MSEPEPPPQPPPPGLFPPLFWVALGFCLTLTLLGAAVGLLGPRWLAGHPPHAASAALTRPVVHGRGAGRIPDHP